MSVPSYLRGKNDLQLLNKARDLAAYTIHITANQNVFDPKYQNGITNNIIDTAVAIFMDAYTANNVYIGADLEDFDMYKDNALKRLALQKDAIRNCNNLLALMQLAQQVFHLKLKRIKFWGKNTVEVRNALRDWNDSDAERFRRRLKELAEIDNYKPETIEL